MVFLVAGPRQVQGSGGEVQTVGGAQPDQDDVHAVSRSPFGEGLGECGRGRAHVVTDHDRAVITQAHGLDERGTGGAHEVGGQLGVHQTSDVIGLDERGDEILRESRHGRHAIRSGAERADVLSHRP